MCGRYTLTAGLTILQRRFGFTAEQITLKPRYNLAPSQGAPVIVVEDSRKLKVMQWGLVPFWAKETGVNPSVETTSLGTLAVFIQRSLYLLAGDEVWGRGRRLSPLPRLAL